MNLPHTWKAGAFQPAAFALGSRVSIRTSPLKAISISSSSLGLLDVSLVGFQSQMFWGLISPTEVSGVGVLGVGFDLLTPQDIFVTFVRRSACGSLCLG